MEKGGVGGKGKKGTMGDVGNVGSVGMSNVGGASSLRAASAGCICVDTSRKAHMRITMYLGKCDVAMTAIVGTLLD